MLLLITLVALFGFFYFLAFTGDAVNAKMPASGTTVPNMNNLLAVGLSSGKHMTVTEEQINGYIAATLKIKQDGSLGSRASIEQVAVRLKDGEVHVVIVRKLFGRPHTVAVHLVPAQEGTTDKPVWSVQPSGGKVGKLPVAGGLLQLVMAPVFQVGRVYSDELRILKYASSLRVEEGRVLLGPVHVQK